ncbi:ribosome-inactivating family protein [Hymenobacter metallicola]|uniref:ribosome-inactivating family protein n=1 Tax=Hymenobacter metallicola TaxID=2563114 RepID=UPI0014368AB9|nr:ribosome-inactivating family protein [Hymenobacter metallicola]
MTTICSAIRANGSAVNVSHCTITHPLVAGNIQLLINLAYQPNGSMPLATASLYVLGFINGTGTYTFALAPFPGGPIPGAVPLVGIDGSYASLGYAVGFGGLQITDANLQASIQTVQAYAGGAYTPAFLTSLTRLIIASSESLRLHQVGIDVNSVLGTAVAYAPDWNAVHAWGGHTLGF